MTNIIEFNEERRFGVEFETITKQGVTRQQIAAGLRAEGIDAEVEGYRNNTAADFARGQWKVKRDASLYGRTGEGAEIVSPPLKGREGLEQVRKVLRVVNRLTVVNRSCGMHIHHEATDLGSQGVANLYRLYWLGQEHISMMLAPSRRANGYCASLETSVNDFARAGFYNRTSRQYVGREALDGRASRIVGQTSGHHVALNFGSLTFRGTIEFRQHQGTTEFAKFKAWMIFTQRMVEKAASARQIRARSFKTLGNLFKNVGLAKTRWTFNGDEVVNLPSEELAEAATFLRERYRHFKARARREGNRFNNTRTA